MAERPKIKAKAGNTLIYSRNKAYLGKINCPMRKGLCGEIHAFGKDDTFRPKTKGRVSSGLV